MNWRYEKKPSVAQQRVRAEKAGSKLTRDGRAMAPVVITGRKIATSFWGNAWCVNLESYRELAYRLERGRSYVRHGAVIDLAVEQGRIQALVSGSEVYTVGIGITALPPARWDALKKRCGGQIGSLLELLEGRLSERVMAIVTERGEGLFPKPGEIHMSCTCLDHAGHGGLCKHIGAVLYGIGARLDSQPQLLFLLRHVDHNELITHIALIDSPATGRKTLASDELASVFGIEMADEDEPAPAPVVKPAAKPAVKAPLRAVTKPVKTPARRATGTALKGAAGTTAPKKKSSARKK